MQGLELPFEARLPVTRLLVCSVARAPFLTIVFDETIEFCSTGEVTAPVPYVLLPGTARSALQFYADVFGGEVDLHTYEEFSRTDGPGDAIAHGVVTGGPVAIFAADAGPDDVAVRTDGMMLALLGTSDPAELRRWFDQLAQGGTVVDPLAEKPWGAADGTVVDRFGLHWLIGYENDA